MATIGNKFVIPMQILIHAASSYEKQTEVQTAALLFPLQVQRQLHSHP